MFSMIRLGLSQNFSKLAIAQEQISSGKRILRPSDDPVGTSQALAYRNRLSGQDRFQAATQNGRSLLDTAASNLQDASGVLSDARAVVLEAMSGTQSANDRRVHAGELRLMRDRLLTIANAKSGDRYLFGGTVTGTQPFEATTNNGRESVAYNGNGEQQELLVGLGESVGVGVPGDVVFDREQRSGTQFGGLTGAASGTTADQGKGYGTLSVRHDATNVTFTNGVQLANGGTSDTLVGAHTLTIDATAGTVRLDNGTALALPASGAAYVADFTVTNEHGAEVHLDFSAWDGTSSTDTVNGAGSISLDGTNWTTLDFVNPDLELSDASTGALLHVDTTNIGRSGDDLVIFGGAVNLFDVMQGLVDDLDNSQGLAPDEQLSRLNLWLGELDRHHANVLAATGDLGARSEHLADVGNRLDDASTEVKGLLSQVEDADYSEVVLDMSRAEQTLQLAQATSARLMQNTLLNFLR